MKLIRFLFCTLILFFSFHAFATISPEIAEIKKRGVLRVGILKNDYPPFFMLDKNGQLTGFDVDLARRIAKDLGVRIEFDRTSKTFDDVVDLASEKKVDVSISKISITLERAKRALYTDPYVSLRHAILINRIKNPRMNNISIKDLMAALNRADATIGVAKGSYHVGQVHQDFPNAKTVEFDTMEEMFVAVTKGAVQYGESHETNIKSWLYMHPDKSILMKYMLRDDSISDVGMAVSWERREFRDWLNVFIDVVSKDGTLDKLKKYYVESFEWYRK